MSETIYRLAFTNPLRGNFARLQAIRKVNLSYKGETLFLSMNPVRNHDCQKCDETIIYVQSAFKKGLSLFLR